jgi:hypothetical protein
MDDGGWKKYSSEVQYKPPLTKTFDQVKSKASAVSLCRLRISYPEAILGEVVGNDTRESKL